MACNSDNANSYYSTHKADENINPFNANINSLAENAVTNQSGQYMTHLEDRSRTEEKVLDGKSSTNNGKLLISRYHFAAIVVLSVVCIMGFATQSVVFGVIAANRNSDVDLLRKDIERLRIKITEQGSQLKECENSRLFSQVSRVRFVPFKVFDRKVFSFSLPLFSYTILLFCLSCGLFNAIFCLINFSSVFFLYFCPQDSKLR